MVWGKKRRQEPKCCDVFTFSEYSCGAKLTLFAHRKSFYRTHHAKLTEGRGKKMEILIKVEKYFLVSKEQNISHCPSDGQSWIRAGCTKTNIINTV